MSEKTPPLIEHMERSLGPIVSGQKFDDAGPQVVLFQDRPFKGAVTYSTLGLSDHVLDQVSGRGIRLELLLSCYSRYEAWHLDQLLAVVAQDLLRDHKALRRGEVVGPAGPIHDGATAHGFYAALPVGFQEALEQFDGSVPPTILVWLVPISHAEMHYVWDRGWSAFEDLLVARDPDLWDLERPTLIAEP